MGCTMRIRGLLSLLLCLSLLCSSLRAESYWNLALENNSQNSDDQNQSEKSSSSKDDYVNDLYMGYFMAIVPGFFIHGLGNMYAGNGRTGGLLLTIEVVSVIGLFFYALSELGENNYPDEKGFGHYALGFVLFGSFFGSWLWDIGTVGGQIEKRRHKGTQVLIGQISKSINYCDPVYGVSLSIRF